jgi:hypothetical protein
MEVVLSGLFGSHMLPFGQAAATLAEISKGLHAFGSCQIMLPY